MSLLMTAMIEGLEQHEGDAFAIVTNGGGPRDEARRLGMATGGQGSGASMRKGLGEAPAPFSAPAKRSAEAICICMHCAALADEWGRGANEIYFRRSHSPIEALRGASISPITRGRA